MHLKFILLYLFLLFLALLALLLATDFEKVFENFLRDLLARDLKWNKCKLGLSLLQNKYNAKVILFAFLNNFSTSGSVQDARSILFKSFNIKSAL